MSGPVPLLSARSGWVGALINTLLLLLLSCSSGCLPRRHACMHVSVRVRRMISSLRALLAWLVHARRWAMPDAPRWLVPGRSVDRWAGRGREGGEMRSTSCCSCLLAGCCSVYRAAAGWPAWFIIDLPVWFLAGISILFLSSPDCAGATKSKRQR